MHVFHCTITDVNVTIPRKIAKLAKEAGVKTFIHVSALSAGSQGCAIFIRISLKCFYVDLDSASVWSQTKAKGELAVREEFPEAVDDALYTRL